jgi:hypothetical protein
MGGWFLLRHLGWDGRVWLKRCDAYKAFTSPVQAPYGFAAKGT